MTDRPRGRRGEEFFALLSLLLVLGGDLALVRVGLDPVDEGYFVEQATRVAQGQLPYRDFDSLYTPGLVYLHAAILSVFGSSPIVDVRFAGLLARMVLAATLYFVCRPLVRPAFAVLPSLYVLMALDRLPFTWEPHPGWPSVALVAVCVWAFARLPFTSGIRRTTWLVAIGATAALVFALKQNAGVLLGLALVLSTAWQGIEGARADVTRALRVIQLLLLLLVVGLTAWLVHPHASPTILAYFLVPLIAAACAALTPVRVSATGRGIRSWLCGLWWMGLGWSLVSLPWLVALLAALDWKVGLLKGFIGVVNQDLLWYPPQGPSGGAWASLLGLGVGLLALVRFRARPLLRAGVLLAILALTVSMAVLTRETGEPLVLALVFAPGRASEGLALFLPVVCIVAGALLSVRSLPDHTAWWLGWMTVASAVTFLTEYPRVDEVHLAWSACLPLATGTVALASVYSDLSQRWRAVGASRYLLAAALVLVPVATGLRNLGVRSNGLVALRGSGSFPVQLASTSALMAPPALAGFVVSTDQAKTLVATAQFVAANTAPGEAIFVYPTSPLLYVLANRPNPTPFDHLYPGAASPADLERIMASFDRTPVNLLVVYESDLLFWGPPAENTSFEGYMVAEYHEIAQFGEYHVLRRN